MPFDGRDERGEQRGQSPDERDGQGEQDERQRRLAALRNLAQQPEQGQQASWVARPGAAPGQGMQQPETVRVPRVATPHPPSPSVASARRPQPRPQPRMRPAERSATWRLGVVALVIVVLGAGTGVWITKGGQRPSGSVSRPPIMPPIMPPINTLDLGAYNLSCPIDMAWSPDGTQIALWATLGDCGNSQTGGPELAIFDTRTGKLTDGITLYSLLTRQSLPQKLLPSPAAWSPDGASLSFSIGYTYYQTPASGAPHGLVTVTLAHNAVRYTADPTPLPAIEDNAMRIWDITSGKLVHTITALAPATRYAWGADGSLAPSDSGGVSVWQTGQINPIVAEATNENVVGPPDEYVPQDWLYTASMPQWSPDHRYLALPTSLEVRLPGGPHAFPVYGCSPQLCDSTPVAPPDKAFGVALAAAQKGWTVTSGQATQTSVQEFYSLDIAWRADGQELATMLPNEDYNLGEPVAKVTIFNTRTGAVVTKLSITRSQVNMGGAPIGLPQIVWSPRGASLAALDYADATLTLWRAE